MNFCERKHARTAQTLPDASSVSTATSATNGQSNNLPHFSLASRIWGDHMKEDIYQIVKTICEEIVFWRKNIFILPSGASGKAFIKEITRLVDACDYKLSMQFARHSSKVGSDYACYPPTKAASKSLLSRTFNFFKATFGEIGTRRFRNAVKGM